MKKVIAIWQVLLLTIMMAFPTLAMAQIDFDEQVEDVAVPFDGGISLLVAAGIGYGVKKARDKRRADKNQPADL